MPLSNKMIDRDIEIDQQDHDIREGNVRQIDIRLYMEKVGPKLLWQI